MMCSMLMNVLLNDDTFDENDDKVHVHNHALAILEM